MVLSAHQPAYLPWLGYFDKLMKSDVFVFLDSVQFERNSFTNRNRIKTPNGAVWLTVPVRTKGHLQQTLIETEIDAGRDWRKSHLKSIFLNYRKAPRFDECYPKLEQLYRKEHRLLADLCWEQLHFWLGEIGIAKKVVRSSEVPMASRKSDLVKDLCMHFGADRYISGTLGRQYLREDEFASSGIAVEFQDYRHPVYPQLWGAFLPGMGIVDLWMNTGDFRLITGA